MAVADFNNDGMLDLFVGSYQDGRQRDIDSHILLEPGGKTDSWRIKGWHCVLMRSRVISLRILPVMAGLIWL